MTKTQIIFLTICVLLLFSSYLYGNKH